MRGRMTMRAAVERNTETGKDPHGNPLPPVFAAHATLPCFIWSNRSHQAYPGDRTAMVEDLRGGFPLDADLAEGDEIASVTNRKGTEIIPGRLRIDAPPQRKHRHIEAALKRVN